MITSLFRKSTPLNYTVLILASVIFYFLYQTNHAWHDNSLKTITENGLVLIILFGSLFVVNFIVKKNGLSRDNSYAILFYLLFHLFIPDIFGKFNLILSNFFVLLAFRRLISLQSLKASKEKVFDASLWIFIAALFHFWSILFIVLVFLSILFHVARDFRNWLLPFIAFFAASVTFLLFALLFDYGRITYLITNSNIDVKVDYFTNVYQNLSLSLYVTIALFFIVSLLMSLSNRPLMLHSSYKKILMLFFIGIVVYVVSPAKSNDLIIFTAAPLAMMATSHIEITPAQWQKEVILGAVIAIALLMFFLQL